MRYIAEIQVFLAQVLANSQTTDSQLMAYRLKLIQTQQGAILGSSQARFSQAIQLYTSEKNYNQQVTTDNLNRYYTAVNAVSNFNSNVDTSFKRTPQ